MSKTQQDRHKLYSNGYCYIITKPSKKSDDELAECNIYWRCETYKNGCKGLGYSFGLNGPLKVTISHNHILNPEKKSFYKVRKS